MLVLCKFSWLFKCLLKTYTKPCENAQISSETYEVIIIPGIHKLLHEQAHKNGVCSSSVHPLIQLPMDETNLKA